MKSFDESDLLQAYWPVIEACEKIIEHYKTQNRVVPDVVARMWMELNEAKKKYNVRRVIE